MATFVWAIVVLFFFEATVKLACLSAGYLPPRNAGATFFDAVSLAAMAVWGCVLLAKMP